ncbi:alpha/beta hydrolase [Ectobacillus funiculus]|uniref:alpha/beta hydrolase n=1 Tax=Ectobacillus funiculus TaxID=137993 RepID=UPI00101C46B1|nr:alpha/beta hydrolase-fold protein [Ectobacillus funiculus]
MSNKGTIEEILFYSEALDEHIPLIIHLPAFFTPLQKHLLVIAQDGKDYFRFGKAASVLDRLDEEEAIDRTIFVGIPYKDVTDRREKYYPNAAQNEAYTRFLAHELTSYLDEKYPTYQMGRGRILIGDSLGGTISLMTALSYPHTFGKVIMQSPFVNEAVMEKVRSFQEPHLLELYHIIGTEETAVKTTSGKIQDFIKPNRELHALLSEKGFPYYYEEFQGGHIWRYWQANLPHALSYMLELS